jgi:hypothetical protein
LLLKNLRGIGKDGLLDAQADKLGPDKTNTNSPQTASNATPRCPPSVVRPEPMPNYHNSLTPTSHYVLDSVSSTVLNLRGRRGQQRHTFKSGRRQVKRVVPPKLETTQRKQATRPRSEAVASCRPPLLGGCTIGNASRAKQARARALEVSNTIGSVECSGRAVGGEMTSHAGRARVAPVRTSRAPEPRNCRGGLGLENFPLAGD